MFFHDKYSALVEVELGPGTPCPNPEDMAHYVLAEGEAGQYFGLYWVDSWRVLGDPSDPYAGLDPMLPSRHDSEGRHLCWYDKGDLKKLQEDAYEGNIEEDEILFARKIDDLDLVKSVLDDLRGLSIPVVAKDPQHVCDGGANKVTIYGEGGEMTFSYWTLPPENWKAIDVISGKVYRLVDGSEDEVDDEE